MRVIVTRAAPRDALGETGEIEADSCAAGGIDLDSCTHEVPFMVKFDSDGSNSPWLSALDIERIPSSLRDWFAALVNDG